MSRFLPFNLKDEVWAGRAKTILPTTDTGYKSYGTGRLLLPAATNYCTNPSMETDAHTDTLADGWVDSFDSTTTSTPVYSKVAALGGAGSVAQRIQYTGVAGDTNKALCISTAVTAVGSFAEGDIVTVSFTLAGTLVGCNSIPYVYFRNAADSNIAQVAGTASPTTTATRYSLTTTAAPALTSRLHFGFRVAAVHDTDTIDITIDDVQIEKSAVLTPYFDGSYPDCVWTGTANASTSTRTASVLNSNTPTFMGTAGSGTVACRWVHASPGVSTSLFEIEGAGAAPNMMMQAANGAGNTPTIRVESAAGSSTRASAITPALNSVNTGVARWVTAASVDLNINGTDAAQLAHTRDLTGALLVLRVGSAPWGGITNGNAVGPMVVSPARKPNSWVAAIQANSGEAFSDPIRLFRDFMDVGDAILPLSDNSVMYLKVGGGCLPTLLSGILSLRFDDGPSSDYSVLFPELVARDLVAGFGIPKDFIGEEDKVTLAQLLEMQTAGMEIMCHSRTHGSDPADIAAFEDESATVSTEMQVLGLNIRSWVQPGTYVAAYHMNDVSFWGGAADTLLRANFEAYEAYIGSAYRTRPLASTERWGANHTTSEHMSLAELEAAVDTTINDYRGAEMLFHMGAVGTDGHLTLADFKLFLDYVQAKVAAGLLSVVTPTTQLVL